MTPVPQGVPETGLATRVPNVKLEEARLWVHVPGDMGYAVHSQCLVVVEVRKIVPTWFKTLKQILSVLVLTQFVLVARTFVESDLTF